MNRLSGKLVLVTGASSGIGAATAELLAAEGARVCMLARRAERLNRLRWAIVAKGGLATAVIGDLSDANQVASLIAEAVDGLGGLDILVNNAGLARPGPVASIDDDDIREMANLNVLAVALAIKAAVPHLARRNGHIVNVGSAAGKAPRPGSSFYGASKAAIASMSESLRLELIPFGIRVTVIHPGAVETELLDYLPDGDAADRTRAWYAAQKPMCASHVANAILYTVAQPASVCVSEIVLRPSSQET